MTTSLSKLPPRYAVSDWHTANKLLSSNSEKLREASHTVRQEARRLRNETDNLTRWTQHDSNSKLEKRIDDITEWKESLEKCLTDTDVEISSLKKEKVHAENAFDAKKIPLDVAIECLLLRENRIGIDLVRDGVEEELHKEVEVIEGIKALLQQKITEAFEQLCLLEEAKHQLQCDLTDKHVALAIDGTCYKLHSNSLEISFQSDPMRTPKNSVTPETWDAYSQYNKLRGEAEMRASQRLREAIFATLEKTANDLEAQRRATDYAFRKRIHESKQAKSQLEWQRKNTTEEIATLKQDILALKEAIQAKLAPLMVAETRLENRTNRPNVELCRDVPQYQLCREVRALDSSVKALSDKLAIAETALQNLLCGLSRIEHDLHVKTTSLQLDESCMEKRKAINVAVKDDVGCHGDDEAPLPASVDSSPSCRTTKQVTFADAPTQVGRASGLHGEFPPTTYRVAYDSKSDVRSGDLDRTLGRTAEHKVGSGREVVVE